jgi:hypothetical protein
MSQRTSIFGKINDDNNQIKTVKVTGNTRAGLKEWNVDVEELNNSDLPISKLWAREKIRDLEEDSGMLQGSQQRKRGDNKKYKAIVDISRKYGIISRSTSFVGIEKKSDTETTTDMVLRVVPSHITEGWHGAQSMPLYSIMSAPAFSRSAYVISSMPAEYDTSICSSISAYQKDLLLDILSLQRAGGGFDMDRSVGDLLQISHPELHSISNKMVMQNQIKDILHTFPSVLQDIAQNMPMGDLISAKDGRPNVDYLIEEILRTSDSRLRRIAADIDRKYQADRMGILGTAIILCILELKFRERRNEWDSVVGKSRSWLYEQIARVGPTIDHEQLEIWVKKFVEGRLTP